jgi:hypothetical protein
MHGDEARARRVGRHRRHLLRKFAIAELECFSSTKLTYTNIRWLISMVNYCLCEADFGRRRARRDRLRVPGERERGAVRDAHQRVRTGARQQGAGVLPLV